MPGFKGEMMRKNMTWWDVICLKGLEFGVALIYYFDTVRQMGNSVFEKIIKNKTARISGARRVKKE